jgi:hypothetical protein
MPKDDLRNGAKGITNGVQIDGGNSYVLKVSNGLMSIKMELPTNNI